MPEVIYEMRFVAKPRKGWEVVTDPAIVDRVAAYYFADWIRAKEMYEEQGLPVVVDRYERALRTEKRCILIRRPASDQSA